MKTVNLIIPNKECKGNTCPIPIEFIQNIVQGIIKITYDKKSGAAEIAYDENTLTEENVISRIAQFGYDVSVESNKKR